MSDKPIIYLLDDQKQTGAVAELKKHGVEAEFLFPTEVTERHLKDATLLAVDEVFDLRAKTENEDWDLPSGLPLAAVPPDGLALAAVLRSAAVKISVQRDLGPLGVAIRTSKLHELALGVPRAVRQPMVAAQYDLEWAVTKEDEDGIDPILQLVALAKALHSFPRDWDSTPQETGLGWLEVPDQPWANGARRQVMACRPPANTATKNRHQVAWLRWLAHRALPFPSFVLSDVYAATSLGVTVESFRAEVAQESSAFGQVTNTTLFTGPLDGLFKPRYWRAGIRHLAAQIVENELDADDPAEVGSALAERHPGLVALNLETPVVTINDQYYPADEPVERTDAERLAPDGWPPYAEPAWATKTDAANPAMARLLAPSMR